ncbi:MAG: efflux RND transporter permease subunit [Lachnospiraceae bacterium]|nr:efflux RND transporter permease subunit [Lachnospiraceae bacterium]
MKGFVKASINRPVTVLMCIIALAVFFVTALTKINLMLSPDMSVPIMVVVTPYPGASPEEVDELVSDKICNACGSLSGIKTINSDSRENASQVILRYNYGTNMDKAYNDLREAVDGVKSDLPTDVGSFTIIEADISAQPDMTLSVTGTSDSVDVANEVNENVVPELKKVSTLARVDVTGGDDKYIRVQIIPEYLNQYGLSLPGIASAIAATNFSSPAGSASYGDQSLNLSSQVKYDTLPELEKVPITTAKGQTIYINDIATVKYAVSDKSSVSRYMGMENVTVNLKGKQSTSPVTLSRGVKPELERVKTLYPELDIEIEYDATDDIMDSLKGVGKTMLQAIFLAMLIIFVFFGDVKGSLIVGSTMPVSIMAAVVCMQAAGISLNVVTMAALIIAIGMMTDNAVVVIEMCFRKHQAGLSFKDAAYEGTAIVINSVTGSTITTLVVYIPLVTMNGIMAQMFKPLASTIIFSLTASLISALLLVPICFSVYKPVERKEIITNRILKWLSKRYRRVLRFSLKWKKSVFLASVLLLAVTLFLATFIKTDMLSETDEGNISIEMTFRPNLDLETMDREVRKVEEFLAGCDIIENYNSSISKTGSTASITAHKKKDVDTPTQEIVDEWNLELKDLSPICQVKVSVPSYGISTSKDSQEYDITASNIEELKTASGKLVEKLEAAEGVLYVSSSFKDSGAKANVVIDPVLASAKGFQARELANLVYMNMSGTKATDVTIDNKKYEVRVKYPEGYYETITDVESMSFINTMGVSVPLTEMAQVTFESAPMTVSRQDGRYIDQIMVYMTSSAKDEVVGITDKIVNDFVNADEGLTFQEDMMTSMMNEEFASMFQAILIAIFLVFFVLAVQFESITVALLIMLCVPFAGIGSILFLLGMGIKLDLAAAFGVMMLAGIVVNNGIILIDMAMQNQRGGMDTVEALVDAGSGRLRPILMTTLTTVIAMVPVALGWSKDAMTMQGMAAVIVGGLSASTVLTLVLLPTFYLLIDRARAWSASGSEKRRSRLEMKVQEQEKLLKEKRRVDARVNLVFPMAGAGSRFAGHGYDCPKPLIELEGEPFFKRAADSVISRIKYERLVFVVLKEHVDRFDIDKKIKAYYRDAKIVVLPHILPGALMTAMEGARAIHNEYPVIFMDCDLMFTSEALYEYYGSEEYDSDGTLLTFRSDLDRYSYVDVKEELSGDVTIKVAAATAEKKVISEHAIAGAYGFINAAVFLKSAEKYLKECPYDEYYISGLYDRMIAAGRKIRVFDTDTYCSFGTPEEYEEAKKYLKELASKAEAKEEDEDEGGAPEPEEAKEAEESEDEPSKTGDGVKEAPDREEHEERSAGEDKEAEDKEAGRTSAGGSWDD